MSISILFLILVLGFIGTYATGLGYVKTLRGEVTKRKTKDTDVLLMSLILGGPMVLLLYALSGEIRLEDKLHHNRFLIWGIVVTLIEAVVLFLLFYFDVIIPLPSNTESTTESTISLLFSYRLF